MSTRNDKSFTINYNNKTVVFKYRGLDGFSIFLRELLIYKRGTILNLPIPKLIDFSFMIIIVEFVESNPSFFNTDSLINSLIEFQNIPLRYILNLTYFLSIKNTYLYFLNSYIPGLILEGLIRGLSLRIIFKIAFTSGRLSLKKRVLIHNDLRTFNTGNILFSGSDCYVIDFESVRYEKAIFYDILLLSYNEQDNKFDSDFIIQFINKLEANGAVFSKRELQSILYISIVKVGIRYYRKTRSNLLLLELITNQFTSLLQSIGDYN